MSTRRFYRQLIEVEVLSEDAPVKWDSLEDIAYAITEGGHSGRVTETRSEQVTGPVMAKLLDSQGSAPEFFRLTEDGEDTEDTKE